MLNSDLTSKLTKSFIQMSNIEKTNFQNRKNKHFSNHPSAHTTLDRKLPAGPFETGQNHQCLEEHIGTKRRK